MTRCRQHRPYGPPARWSRRSAARDFGNERGAIALFSVVAVAALLVAIGLAVDGGNKIKAAQRADALAAEAARAGAQAISFDDPSGPTLDLTQACAIAVNHLADLDVTPSCHPIDSTTLHVDVVMSADTIFLVMIGQPAWRVTGSAEARIAHGVGVEQE